MTKEVLTDYKETEPSIRQLFDLYKTSVQFKSNTTRQAYFSDVNKFVKFTEEGDRPQVDTTTIQDHLESLTQGSSSRSVYSLRHFFNWLVETKKLKPEEKPTISSENTAKPKLFKNISTISGQEIDRLLEQAGSNPRDLALFTIALKTGAKSQGILTLTKEQILKENPQAIKIRLIHKTVQLDPKSSEIVSGYLGSLTKRGQYIFADPKSDYNQPLSRNSVHLLLKPYRKALGRDDLTLSSLRYTYAANLDLRYTNILRKTLGISRINSYYMARALRAKLAQSPQIPLP